MTRVQTRQFSSENRKGFLKKEIAPIMPRLVARRTEKSSTTYYVAPVTRSYVSRLQFCLTIESKLGTARLARELLQGRKLPANIQNQSERFVNQRSGNRGIAFHVALNRRAELVALKPD